VPEDIEPWSRKERLKNEREALGLYVSGHPLEEFVDAVKVHTIGGIAALKELVASGKIKDKEEVSLGVMVSTVTFKTNPKGEPWAILQLEDLTDRMEALMYSTRYDLVTKKRSRPYELFGHLALPDALLRVTGELKVETVTSTSSGGEGEEEDEQTVLKLIVCAMEPLEDFQGRGFTGAVVKLPVGEYPPNLLPILRLHCGNLPLTLEYHSHDCVVAKVKPGNEFKLRFDPDLAEKLAKETGCGLSWIY
jgi:DNA polymerase-3 subunit alpha